jgi:hypothetical protein
MGVWVQVVVDGGVQILSPRNDLLVCVCLAMYRARSARL